MQEMTMVERVAKAIYETALERAPLLNPLGFTVDYPGWEDLEDPDRTSALGEARAAIEAMREPTEAMLGAFDRMTDDSGSVLVKTGYRAMISAALSE